MNGVSGSTAPLISDLAGWREDVECRLDLLHNHSERLAAIEGRLNIIDGRPRRSARADDSLGEDRGGLSEERCKAMESEAAVHKAQVEAHSAIITSMDEALKKLRAEVDRLLAASLDGLRSGTPASSPSSEALPVASSLEASVLETPATSAPLLPAPGPKASVNDRGNVRAMRLQASAPRFAAPAEEDAVRRPPRELGRAASSTSPSRSAAAQQRRRVSPGVSRPEARAPRQTSRELRESRREALRAETSARQLHSGRSAAPQTTSGASGRRVSPSAGAR